MIETMKGKQKQRRCETCGSSYMNGSSYMKKEIFYKIEESAFWFLLFISFVLGVCIGWITA